MEQVMFEFITMTTQRCETCEHAWWSHDLLATFVLCRKKVFEGRDEGKEYCLEWKRGESMPQINFREMREEELRQELQRIRDERSGIGRKVRREHKERRIKESKKGSGKARGREIERLSDEEVKAFGEQTVSE